MTDQCNWFMFRNSLEHSTLNAIPWWLLFLVRKKTINYIDKTLLQKLEAIFSGFERKVFFQKCLKGNALQKRILHDGWI